MRASWSSLTVTDVLVSELLHYTKPEGVTVFMLSKNWDVLKAEFECGLVPRVTAAAADRLLGGGNRGRHARREVERRDQPAQLATSLQLLGSWRLTASAILARQTAAAK